MRIIIKQVPPEDGHVAGGRQMAIFGQAMGILEGGPRHSKRLSCAVHAAGELCLGAFDGFAKGGCGIVGRFDRGGADEIAQCNRAARAHAQLAGGLGGGMLGNHDLVIKPDFAILDGLKDDVERHHLGQ